MYSSLNKKLLTTNTCYVFLAVFGMNVGGVPWTGQKDPTLKDGFRNVILLCVAMLLLALVCFSFPALYTRILAWRRRRVMRRSWSLNRKSFLSRTHGIGVQERRGYLRLWENCPYLQYVSHMIVTSVCFCFIEIHFLTSLS